VAPTFAFRDQLARLYELETRGRVIRNGAEPATDEYQPKRPIILGAGRVWDRAKNLAGLASIASMLDWPVRIAGASDVEDRAAAEPCLRCEFLGELPHKDLRREFRAASVFVSPALYEPFGLSVLEAATAGCALVLSDIATFRELWNGAANFFDPLDKDAMIGCLRSLTADDARRTDLQRAAAERAERYQLGTTIASYVSLYQELLAGASVPMLMPEGERMIA
jgi:glycosyltransferase involved in cell wall biosynthesis